MPALYTSDISWGSAQRKRKAKEYAKRNRTSISKIVQDHFDDICDESDVSDQEIRDTEGDTFLWRRRTTLGMTLAEVASRLGVSYQSARLYERGARKPQAAILEQLAKVLHATPEEVERHFQVESVKRRIPGVEIEDRSPSAE